MTQARKRQQKNVRRQKRKQKKARRPWRPRADYRKNWLDCQRHFLTSMFWKAGHAVAKGFGGYRWNLLPLVMVAILTMFLTASSAGERFEEAREYWTRMNPNRRRVGKTFAGFQAALARLPRRALKAMQPQLRDRIAEVLKDRWEEMSWEPFACDGSRLRLPRYTDLERRFGTAGKGDFPQMWVTCLVHLLTGVPWSWKFGKGKASERDHLLQLIDTLPERALLMADAGFTGYRTWSTLMQRNRHFLIRLSSSCRFYADYQVKYDFKEGKAYLWQKGKKPLELRLIRLPGHQGKRTKGAKHDLWLVTNVMEPTRLSRATAGIMYRMRWEQEVFYRSYKCTLRQAKLSSRTVRQVVR